MLRCPLALILLAATTITSAQNVENRDYRLTVDVELVQLPVSVSDKQGLPVRGLRQEHFAVYEDKVQQNMALFKQEDIPVSIGLVIDASGSMSSKIERLSTAAMTFVQESNPEDETSIFGFGDEVELVQDFTRNTRELSSALAVITPHGSTSLYDAILEAAKHLSERGFHEKKVLLVVSDGEDNHSQKSLKQALEALRESKIILYSVGLLNPFDNGVMFGSTAKKALKQLAEVTGGASYFPRGVGEVQEICRTIARDLRNQYTIGYRPSNEKLDGSWRKVLVKLNPPKGAPSLRVRTIQGYYAPVARKAQDSTTSELASTVPKTAQPPPALELNPPKPYSDSNASVTPSVEEHVDTPPVRIGGRLVQAEPMFNDPPVYPEVARRARVEGPVVLNAVVTVQGALNEIEIVSGHPLLVQAALDAVRKWRYRPGTLNEQTIEMPITIRVNFVLKYR